MGPHVLFEEVGTESSFVEKTTLGQKIIAYDRLAWDG